MNLREHLKEQMKDAAFEKEYTKLAPEYEIVRQILLAREEQNITQAELAHRTGLKQSNISRLESGDYNPSLALLQKVAQGLGKELYIEFRDLPPNP